MVSQDQLMPEADGEAIQVWFPPSNPVEPVPASPPDPSKSVSALPPDPDKPVADQPLASCKYAPYLCNTFQVQVGNEEVGGRLGTTQKALYSMVSTFPWFCFI